MAKTYLDMTQIPSDKIKKILEEALDGCYDTFNRVMESYGFTNGVPADDFVNKSAKNVLVRKRELMNAFLELEVDGNAEAEAGHHAWMAGLVRKMLERFLDITATREAAIAENIAAQTAALSEKIEENKRDIASLRQKHEEDAATTGEQISSLEQRVHDLEAQVSDLRDSLTDLTESVKSFSFDLKLVQQAIQNIGTQSHDIHYSVAK